MFLSSFVTMYVTVAGNKEILKSILPKRVTAPGTSLPFPQGPRLVSGCGVHIVKKNMQLC